jgi:uroporphyrinogen decarboxylase
MTSRELVKKFLNGEKVDRIPMGLGGCETAGLHNLTYHHLKELLGVNDRKNRVSTFMNNAIFEPPVLKAMGGDVILLHSGMCPSRFWGSDADKEWKDLDIWGVTLQVANKWKFRKDADGTYWWDDYKKCPPGAYYFDPVPSMASSRLPDMSKFPSPDDFNPSHELPEELLKRLEEDAKWLYENTDFAITCGETVRDLQYRPGGTESWWMQMALEPEAAHEFLHKACEAAKAQLIQLDQAVGKYCECLLIADDIGDTRGVTVGADRWREIYKPHYKDLFGHWHKVTNMKVSLHCCGSNYDILDDLMECGVDVLNPVQISANKMDPAKLKRKGGDKIIFYGGVYDAVLMKPETSEEEVYNEVRRNIEILSRGGGYMFAGVHNLPPEMPMGHLRAFLQAYLDSRDRRDLTG